MLDMFGPFMVSFLFFSFFFSFFNINYYIYIGTVDVLKRCSESGKEVTVKVGPNDAGCIVWAIAVMLFKTAGGVKKQAISV